jgi:hypothetical protein
MNDGWGRERAAGLRPSFCDRCVGDEGYDDELQSDQCEGYCF